MTERADALPQAAVFAFNLNDVAEGLTEVAQLTLPAVGTEAL